MRTSKIALVGATGNVGRVALSILFKKKYQADSLSLVASKKSANLKIYYGDNKSISVKSIDDFDFTSVDFALFTVSSNVSKIYVKDAIKAGCIVIDNSSYFRMDENVPLIVAGVNLENSFKGRIISNPNCCVIPLTIILKPLLNEFGISKVLISTYQSTSGAGRLMIEKLRMETSSNNCQCDHSTIAYNVIPKIGDLLDSGYTSEEDKIREETRKILNSDISVSATCVRVPTFVGHALSVTVQLKKDLDLRKIRSLLLSADDVIMVEGDTPYVTPNEVEGTDYVYMGRLRKDTALENAITFWVVSDNLRKGAALNAIQILEYLIANKMENRIANVMNG